MAVSNHVSVAQQPRYSWQGPAANRRGSSAPVWLLCAFSLGICHCAPAQPEPASPVAASPRAASLQVRSAPPASLDGPARSVRVATQALRFELPDALRWRAVKQDTWTAFEHAATRSHLEFKRWHQGELVDARDCEAQALLWKPALVRPAGAPFERRAGVWPAGYRGELAVYVSQQGSELVGEVRLYSAQLRECFAVYFTTRQALQGDDAGDQDEPRRAVAERLAVIAERVVPSFAALDVDQRVRRARPALERPE